MGGSVPQIPGIKAERQLADQFRKEVADLLGRRSLAFPGAQPVSFARRHITELQSEDYYVCEKSDGIRCLMYFAEGEEASEIHYLIDRKNDYYYVPDLHFPVPNDDTFQNFHIGTIIDGELVNDRLPNGGMQLRYLVFDCLMLDGNSLMHRTLDKRLAYFRDRVYNPYQALYKKFPEELQYVPFQVEFKNMEFSYGIEMMFRDILPKLPHGNDGLIFTARNQPYKFGTDEHILKWKPETENSVDFRLTLDFPLRDPDSEEEAEGETLPVPDWEAMPTFVLSVVHNDREYREFAKMYATDEEWENLKALNRPLQETIVECAQDGQRRWRFLRFRDDKHDANHISTVLSVMESIEDRVGKQDLLAAAKKIRDEWKRRQREEEERGKPEHVSKRRQQEEDERRRKEDEKKQRQQQQRERETRRRRQQQEEGERRREADRRRTDETGSFQRHQSEDRVSQGGIDGNGDEDEYLGPRYAESTDDQEDDVVGLGDNDRSSSPAKRRASDVQMESSDGHSTSPAKRHKTEELGSMNEQSPPSARRMSLGPTNGHSTSPKREVEDEDVRSGSPVKESRKGEIEEEQVSRRSSSSSNISPSKRAVKQEVTNGHSMDPDPHLEDDEQGTYSSSKTQKGEMEHHHHHDDHHYEHQTNGDGRSPLEKRNDDERSPTADERATSSTTTTTTMQSKEEERPSQHQHRNHPPEDSSRKLERTDSIDGSMTVSILRRAS